ncbi:MAG: outer membrane beta-barrel protein, partial [Aureliella sp.]
NYYAQSPSDAPSPAGADAAQEGAPAPIVQGQAQQLAPAAAPNAPAAPATGADKSLSYLAPNACSNSCDIGCGQLSCDDLCDGLGGSGNQQWKLFQRPVMGFNVGGWSEVAYHTANNAGAGLFGAGGAPANFNNYADHVQLQQQWLYAERIADGSNGLGFGGRVDYVYGTDGPDTQSFGMANNSFDNSWDNGGAYGHAMPQLYGEVAYGKLSVKAGRFFTIIGNEVVQATGNFFYSRQFTFYNAEPFTHTGVLSTYALDEDTTVWNGYVMGWDSGFQDNGDAYLSGIKRNLTDRTYVVYTSALGRFNDDAASPNNGERGQIHSGILNTKLTDKLTYISQMDYLQTDNAAGAVQRNTFGSIHYLIYNINDKWAIGSRSEWFNYTTQQVHNADLYNQTVGLNYKPNANLIVRPEVRWIWDKNGVGGPVGVNEISPHTGQPMPSQAVFGTDMIFVF